VEGSVLVYRMGLMTSGRRTRSELHDHKPILVNILCYATIIDWYVNAMHGKLTLTFSNFNWKRYKNETMKNNSF